LPASPVSPSDTLIRWILKDLGWFEAQCRDAIQRWPERLTRNWWPQCHSSWPNRRSPASEIARSN